MLILNMLYNKKIYIMKPTDYIERDNLKNIPFFLCQVVEDEENLTIWANVSCTITTMWDIICGLPLFYSVGKRTAQPIG